MKFSGSSRSIPVTVYYQIFSDFSKNTTFTLPGRVAQSVTCLATDACLTADPGVASSIPGPVPYFRGD